MNYWNPKILSQRLPAQSITSDLASQLPSSCHSRSLRFDFSCRFLITSPGLGFLKMAPRNLTQTVVQNGNQEDCSDLALGKFIFYYCDCN